MWAPDADSGDTHADEYEKASVTIGGRRLHHRDLDTYAALDSTPLHRLPSSRGGADQQTPKGHLVNDVLSLAADPLTIAGTSLSVILEIRRTRKERDEEQGGEEGGS